MGCGRGAYHLIKLRERQKVGDHRRVFFFLFSFSLRMSDGLLPDDKSRRRMEGLSG